jgi:hypothetical protein
MVGSQVLGVYVYGNYFPNAVLGVVNYVSIFLAIAIYLFICYKFYLAHQVSSDFKASPAIERRG